MKRKAFCIVYNTVRKVICQSDYIALYRVKYHDIRLFLFSMERMKNA